MMDRSNDTTTDDDVETIAETLYREEVQRARLMRGEEKLSAGPELFDMACQITLAGIRNQYQGVTESAALEILRQRLAIRRRNE